MRRTTTFGTIVVALTAGVSVVAGPAHAATTELFVNNTVACSDAGTGSQAQPFCTLAAASTTATAGQTVKVTGVYDEHLTIARSGTPGSPITFRSDGDDASYANLTGTNAGITVDGQHDVAVVGFRVQGDATGPAVDLANSTRLVVERVELLAPAAGASPRQGVRVAAVTDSALTKVRVLRDVRPAASLDAATQRVVLTSWYVGAPEGNATGVEVLGTRNSVIRSGFSGTTAGIKVGPGATDTVVASNIFSSTLGAGIENADATGTAITNNTVYKTCGTGIRVAGASTGVSVQNNYLSWPSGPSPATCAQPGAGIGVHDSAVSGTLVDYNTVVSASGRSPYFWNGPVATLAAFRTASGQGAHDADSFGANIDSANSAAPGWQRDYDGKTPEDNPAVPNVGAGPIAYADRGARESTRGPSAYLELRQRPGGEVVADASNSTAGWSPTLSFTFDFGDGTVVTQATPVATHTYASRYGRTVTLTLKNGNGATSTVTKSISAGDGYIPTGPVRVLDTRERIGVETTTPVAPGGTLVLPVTGRAGVPATGVTAVTMNVTVTQPTRDGFLTVYPDGETPPNASNLNWTPGLTVPNLVVVSVVNGKVAFRNTSPGTVHVVADLVGYHSADGGGIFASLGPVRVLDTRERIGVDTTTPVAPGGTLVLPVAGRVGVPATGVTAVTMNVTVTEPTRDGFLTVYPDGKATPNASNLNWTPGLTVPNLVVVPVVNGEVAFRNTSAGTVHVIADIVGYHSNGVGDVFHPQSPYRALDTRSGIGADRNTPVPPGGSLDLDLRGLTWQGATAVVLNVTVTEPTAPGFLTVAGNGDKPNASNLNWRPGQTVPNLVVVPLERVDGIARFYNTSPGSVHVVADVVGYYGS
ncbi:PKD domain-containing protein [Longispora sp. NPDC051575]|uniref:PKD domain-containing protein n=1 Tax=Longispora sp. NPDC051575 TaxID=3154943 RepID=UPI00342AAA3A